MTWWRQDAPVTGAIEPIMGATMSIVDFMLSVRQQRMLRAILLHPDRQFGSNELVTIAGPGNGAGKRVLDGFERSGLVTRIARGNRRLYRANTEHPIYPELRAICRKTFGIGDTVASELAPFADRIILAFVFGSVARGTERADSDLDLMVVGTVDISEMGSAIQKVSDAVGRTVDLNLHSPEEWACLRNDRVIRSILIEKRIVVSMTLLGC